VWKPSELAPLSALAAAALLDRAIAEEGAPDGLSQVLVGGADVGEALVGHPGVALLSATGSTRMGRAVGPRVADRFGRSLLELGGNNAAIVTPSADLDLTTRGVVFAAAGTAGQRCTTMRRVIAHVDVVDELTDRVTAAYRRLPIGSPTAEGTLVGPLIHDAAYKAMQDALEAARQQGGEVVVGGGRRLADEAPDAYYVEPAVVRMPEQTDIVRQETFAPILYVLPYRTLEEAIALNNDVPQGLSSSIFTSDHAEAERLYRESLALKRSLGDRWGAAYTLEGLAAVAQAAIDPRAEPRTGAVAASDPRATAGCSPTTCSTPGSPRRSGRTRRSAGRARRRSSRATTRATSTRRPARSSASGRTG